MTAGDVHYFAEAAFFLGDFFCGLAFFPAAAFFGFAAADFFVAAFFLGEAAFFGDPATGEDGAAAALDSASSFTGDSGVFGVTAFLGLPFAADVFFGFAAFFAGDLAAFLPAVFLAGLFAFGPFAVFFAFAAVFFAGLFFGDFAGDGDEPDAAAADSELAGAGRFTAFDLAGAFFGDALRARAGLFAAFGFAAFAAFDFVTADGQEEETESVRRDTG